MLASLIVSAVVGFAVSLAVVTRKLWAAWFWGCMCDWTSRLYLYCCKKLWIAGTGTPVPDHVTVGMFRVVDNADDLAAMFESAATRQRN